MMAAHCSGSDGAARGDLVVAAARGWIGTPYLHQASRRGAGADCLGLVRGVWREVIGREPETPPPYTPDWSEPSRRERLMEAATRNLERVRGEWRVGDVLLFRMRRGAPAKHLGILSATGGVLRMIHAYSGHGVVESPLGEAWRRRIVAVFRFPED